MIVVFSIQVVNIRVMKKVILILLAIISTSFANVIQTDSIENFIHDFRQIKNTYEKSAMPYFHKFAILQSSPLRENSTSADTLLRNRLIDNMAKVHKTNFIHFGNELFKTMTKNRASSYQKKEKMKLLEDLEFAYKTQFLYLDYQFFENSRNEIERLK